MQPPRGRQRPRPKRFKRRKRRTVSSSESRAVGVVFTRVASIGIASSLMAVCTASGLRGWATQPSGSEFSSNIYMSHIAVYEYQYEYGVSV